MIKIDKNYYQLNPIPFNTVGVNPNLVRYAELDKLFPFQLISRTPKEASLTATLKAVGCADIDITEQLIDAGLEVTASGNIRFPAKYSLNLDISPGQYSLVINDGVNSWASVKFNLAIDIPSLYTRVSWSNKTSGESLILNGGIVDFSNSFEYYAYIDTGSIGADYGQDEEVTKTDLVDIPTRVMSSVTYKMAEFDTDPSLMDALRIVNLCDDITINSEDVEYVVQNILFTPKWTDRSNIGVASCEFSVGNAVQRLGFTRTKSLNVLRDFNNDFNNDF